MSITLLLRRVVGWPRASALADPATRWLLPRRARPRGGGAGSSGPSRLPCARGRGRGARSGRLPAWRRGSGRAASSVAGIAQGFGLSRSEDGSGPSTCGAPGGGLAGPGSPFALVDALRSVPPLRSGSLSVSRFASRSSAVRPRCSESIGGAVVAVHTFTLVEPVPLLSERHRRVASQVGGRGWAVLRVAHHPRRQSPTRSRDRARAPCPERDRAAEERRLPPPSRGRRACERRGVGRSHLPRSGGRTRRGRASRFPGSVEGGRPVSGALLPPRMRVSERDQGGGASLPPGPNGVRSSASPRCRTGHDDEPARRGSRGSRCVRRRAVEDHRGGGRA